MLISVIVPVFNAEFFLIRCIESLLISRGNKNVELILINDGSTDDSEKICHDYQCKYDFIKAHNILNSGPSAARNRGLEIAKGDFICFVDSDDYVERDYFEVIFKHLSHELDILVFGFIKVKDGLLVKNPFKAAVLEQKEILEIIRSSSTNMNLFWYPWTKVYSASLVKRIRFNNRVRIGEDTIFNIEAFLKSKKVLIIDYCMYNYVNNVNSLTQAKYKENLLDNMEEHFKNRLLIHKNNPQISDGSFYADISRYYLNHILFWLISNSANSPSKQGLSLHLSNIRNSIIYNFSFEHINWKLFSFRKKILILMFKFRLFKPLMILYKNV